MVNKYQKDLVRNRILKILDNTIGPISILEIGQRVGQPYSFIHLNLVNLMQEGIIRIETRGSQNVILKADKQ